MNIYSSLIAELKDKAYRDAYVSSQIKIGLPFQARALRVAKGWTQEDLAAKAGMSQPRIAEIEKPSERRFNLETLLRIASAFDVGLQVRFVPLSEIVHDEDAFDPASFNIPTFAQELEAAEARECLLIAGASANAQISTAQRRMQRRQNRSPQFRRLGLKLVKTNTPNGLMASPIGLASQAQRPLWPSLAVTDQRNAQPDFKVNKEIGSAIAQLSSQPTESFPTLLIASHA